MCSFAHSFVCLFTCAFIYFKGDEENDFWVKSQEEKEKKGRQKKGNSRSLVILL